MQAIIKLSVARFYQYGNGSTTDFTTLDYRYSNNGQVLRTVLHTIPIMYRVHVYLLFVTRIRKSCVAYLKQTILH